MLQFEEIIGRGGFGTVYRGTMQTDDGLVRRVAVKVLSDEMGEDLRAVARFRDEARLLALLDHPALVPVYTLQQVDGRWAVVMGLVEGVDLRELIKRGVRFPAACVCEIGIQVAELLGAIWQQPHPETGAPLSVVHRDIKPHNVMIDVAGRVRVLDLGVASAQFEAREMTTRGASGLAGTLAYMSPQRWGRFDDRHKGDVYALGATLYHLAAHEPPPEAGPDVAEHLVRIDAALGRLAPEFGPLLPALRAAFTWDHEARPDADTLANLLHQAMRRLEGPTLRELARGAVAEVLAERQGRVEGGPSLLGTSWDLTPVSDDVLQTGWIFESDAPKATLVHGEPGRRWLGWVAAAVALALVSAWWLAPPAPRGPPLSFGVPPVHPQPVMAEAMEPLRAHLQRSMRRPVRLEVAASYADTRAAYEAGRVDVALLTPLLYVQAKAGGGVRELAMTDPVVMSGHEGVLLVARDVAEIDDLRGATICFTDPNSTSGYLLPRRYLRKAGLLPDRDYQTRLSGGHQQVVADLAAGACRAAGTFENAYSDAARQDKTNGAQILARTGLAAHNTVACAAGVDAAACDAVREALLAFRPGDAGSDAFRINGFVPHDPAVFTDLAAAWSDEQPGVGPFPRPH